MKRFTYCLLLATGLLLQAHTIYSQWGSTAEIKQSVFKFARKTEGLYNGPEYEPHPVIFSEGHPFFDKPEMQFGTIAYDGHVYDSVRLMIDLVKDELLLQHYNGYSRIQLLKEKVDSFSIGTQRFRNIRPQSIAGMNPGYYQVLHSGAISLYQRLRKTYQTYYRGSMSGVDVFQDIDHYLVKNNGVMHFKNKKSFLKIIGAAQAIDQRLKANQISYRKTPGYYMQQALILNEESK